MRRSQRRWTAQGIACLVALAALTGALPCLAQQATPLAPSRTVTCAFSNLAYSGWCRVTQDLPRGTSPARLCRSVLGCLNDVRCVKTYCNATTIRGGWKLEEIKTSRKTR